jgi:hypothetical protein
VDINGIANFKRRNFRFFALCLDQIEEFIAHDSSPKNQNYASISN